MTCSNQFGGAKWDFPRGYRILYKIIGWSLGDVCVFSSVKRIILAKLNLSCTWRAGYVVNQPFIWEMVGWAPFFPLFSYVQLSNCHIFVCFLHSFSVNPDFRYQTNPATCKAIHISWGVFFSARLKHMKYAPCMVYLPTGFHNLKPNVGKYTINGAYGIWNMEIWNWSSQKKPANLPCDDLVSLVSSTVRHS